MKDSVYTPGAGHVPPVLAGRDELLRDWEIALSETTSAGRVRARDTILCGPRGVGKTAAMAEFAARATAQGFDAVSLQAVDGHGGLPESLFQFAVEHAGHEASPWHSIRGLLERVSGINFTLLGAGAGISLTSLAQQAASAVDASGLARMLATVADAARRTNRQGGLLITIDEMQQASAPDLALISAALHRLNVDHPKAAVMFAATGLPYLPDALDQAGVTHAERLYVFEPLPLTLSPADATYAITEPARRVGVVWEPEAAEQLVTATNGYPAHLQLFADIAWRAAKGPHAITARDVASAIPEAQASLEKRSLNPRLARLTPKQREFLAALAVIGGTGPIKYVAATLGKSVKDVSWLRDELMKAGDIFTPSYGVVALAVPTFGQFLLERYPEMCEASPIDLLPLATLQANAASF